MSARMTASIVAALVLAPSAVHAFSDPERFAEGAHDGGGGGRFFTGSPVDGFTCSVCHRGGREPGLNVLGLPVEGFVPGQSYDVEVQWDEPEASHALALEIITRAGGDGGSIKLFEGNDVTDGEKCGSASVDAGKRASFITKSGARRIVGISDCGASSLRFRMTAPDEHDLAFSMVAVRSDLSGTADGDGVHELARVLYRQGEQPSTSGSCSAAPASTHHRSWLWFAPGLALLSRLRSSRKRRRAST